MSEPTTFSRQDPAMTGTTNGGNIDAVQAELDRLEAAQQSRKGRGPKIGRAHV